MEIKEIKFNGYTASPPDYECPDGDLASAINVLPEDGALIPMMPPKVLIALESPRKVIFVHKAASYAHYIIYNAVSGELYWMDTDDTRLSDGNTIATYTGITHVNAVGNTLMAFTSSAIRYFLWQQGDYKYLGDHLPNLELSFGLRGNPRFFSTSANNGNNFVVTFDSIAENDIFNAWTDENKQKITSQVMAKVNKFLREQTIDKGRFALPFFVRYALRLYDGSLACHSAPILMNPSTKTAPIVYWNRISGNGSYTQAECDIMLMSAQLDYKLVYDSGYDYNYLRSNWSDIVKSVDVFISKPIYTFDQDGECDSFTDDNNFDTKYIGALAPKLVYWLSPAEDSIVGTVKVDGETLLSSTSAISKLQGLYTEWTYGRLFDLYKKASERNAHPGMTIHLPELSADEVKETINNTSHFYHLCSLELDELAVVRTAINIEEGYLQSLVNREVMTDDYLTHDRLVAEYSYGYNSRLNLSGVKRELFRGFYADSMFAYLSASGIGWSVTGDNNEVVEITLPILNYSNLTVRTYIKEEDGTHVVTATGVSYLSYYLSQTVYPTTEDANAGTNGYLLPRSWGCYVFYPNVNAFKMIISDNIGAYGIDLKAHEFLNGAYGLIDYELARSSGATAPSITRYDNIISLPNKIYTSEVNNPFYFPVTGINTIGTGKILSICSAVKALSQGQFGQFPLYAFTDEGVWALEVGTDGSYTARQPVTRDVCINTHSITQIDSAVLFATDRGIMLISGSTSVCISESLDAENPVSFVALPYAEDLLLDANIIPEDVKPKPFLEYIKGCRMLYDYINQRIIVFHPSYTYAYVYSLKTKLWGMMMSPYGDSVNAYPHAYAMDKSGNLVDCSDSDADDVQGVIVTRPFKLDAPDVLKTVYSLIVRGKFRRKHVKTALYGSRDLFKWHVVHSSTDHLLRNMAGTPYKYFRLMMMCELEKGETLYGCSVQFAHRLTNRLR